MRVGAIDYSDVAPSPCIPLLRKAEEGTKVIK